jgi:hypothetical protein
MLKHSGNEKARYETALSWGKKVKDRWTCANGYTASAVPKVRGVITVMPFSLF